MHEALTNAHLYPDGGAYYLREALATKLGRATREHHPRAAGLTKSWNFSATHFSIATTTSSPPQHAFVAYKLIAAVFGARTIEIPSPDMRHHLDEMIDAITPRTRLIFIANPNNPTGTLLTQDEIDRFMTHCRTMS